MNYNDYDRRAEIGKNAENKFEALANLLDSMVPETIQDTILFVSDKQIQRGFDILSQEKSSELKLQKVNSASKVVNDEGDTERQEIIGLYGVNYKYW